MLQSDTECYRVLQSNSSASTWTNFWACWFEFPQTILIYLTNPYFNFSLLRYSLQTKIGMPSSASSPYNVVITFDADTTIVISHHLKSSKYMQFPSKNQKYKQRPNSEIHESETVCRVLVTATVAQSIVQAQPACESTSQAKKQHCYLQYLNLFDIYLRRNYFSVTYTGTIPMELFNVKKVGFCSVQLKRFKRNCQHFRIVFETILIR